VESDSEASGFSDVDVITVKYYSPKVMIPEEIFKEITKQTNDPGKYISERLMELYGEGLLFGKKEIIEGVKESQNEWTTPKVMKLLEALEESMKHRSDVEIILSLLVAYTEIGSYRPNSAELRAARGLTDVGDEVWKNELRTSKSRLTITARNMDMPKKIFSSPYGQGVKRVHPINPIWLDALIVWRKEKEKPTLEDPSGFVSRKLMEDTLKLSSPYHASTPTSLM